MSVTISNKRKRKKENMRKEQKGRNRKERNEQGLIFLID